MKSCNINTSILSELSENFAKKFQVNFNRR